MRGRWFVTGTDTDVGKTVVGCCLAAAAEGTVLAAKAVASGGIDDAVALGRAGGHPPRVYTSWRTPVSPHRAAAIEGRPLDVPGLEAWAADLAGDTVILEGAGGWRVPLAPGYDVSDLARAFGAPVIVVSADRLGTVNHTRLTVEAIRNDGLSVAGIALVRRRTVGEDPSVAFNEDDLRALGVPLGVVPALDPTDRGALAQAGRALWACLRR